MSGLVVCCENAFPVVIPCHLRRCWVGVRKSLATREQMTGKPHEVESLCLNGNFDETID